MTCRNCKFLGVKLDSLGRRTSRKDISYPCTVPLPPEPILPASVSPGIMPRLWGDNLKWPMEPEDGESCALHQPIVSEPK